MDEMTREREPVAAYIAETLAMHPHIAIKAGLHAYDGQVADWSATSITRRVALLRQFIPLLEANAAQPLPPTESNSGAHFILTATTLATWDARLALRDASAELFRWETLRQHVTNPLVYLPLLDLSPYIKRRYAPLPERLAALVRHVEHLPDVLAAARAQLRPPIASALLDQSIMLFEGLAHFHNGDLITIVHGAYDHALFMRFQAANRRTLLGYRETIAALRAMQADAPTIVPLGAEVLHGLLATHEGIDLSLDAIQRIGEADLACNTAALRDIAAQLHMTPAEALRNIGRSHPPATAILAHTRVILNELRRFSQARELLSVPDAMHCVVQETAPFMRSGSAFIDAPGPFETVANDAYYYVTLPDQHWPAEEQEAWLAKLNLSGLANTTIHEAWPGHYLQFLHLAHAPSVASKLFTCMSFTEGWAHYAEQLMVEAGFYGDQPAFHLQQLSMALLRDCRLLVAIGLHTASMTLEDAAALIERAAFFPPIRAHQEALRGARDPSYLNYTLGKLLFLQLRDDLRQRYPDWTTRVLHDRLLGFGAPPLPQLRGLLLGE